MEAPAPRTSPFRLTRVKEAYNVLSGELDTTVTGVAFDQRLRFEFCDAGEVSLECACLHTVGGRVLRVPWCGTSQPDVYTAQLCPTTASWGELTSRTVAPWQVPTSRTAWRRGSA